jgi:hypothetical protein
LFVVIPPSNLDVSCPDCYNSSGIEPCPIRLEAQDVALSRPKQGFETPMGHSLLHLLRSWSILITLKQSVRHNKTPFQAIWKGAHASFLTQDAEHYPPYDWYGGWLPFLAFFSEAGVTRNRVMMINHLLHFLTSKIVASIRSKVNMSDV